MSYNIVIPAIQKEWKVPSNQIPWQQQAIKAIQKLKLNYSTEFKNASILTGVPQNILYGFAAVESGGALNNTLNGASKGVMQVNPSSCWNVMKNQLKVDTWGNFKTFVFAAPEAFTINDALVYEQNLGAIDNKPANLYVTIKPSSPEIYAYCGQRMVADAQFAINIGSMLLAQLIAGTIASVGQVRLDHIVIKYNAGGGRFRQVVTNKGLESASVDTTTIYNNLPIPVSQAYIVKLLGINGYMDIQKKGLV